MKLNPTYSSGDINFIHDEAQIFVESIINNLDDNITPVLGDDGNYHYVYLTVNKANGFFYIGKITAGGVNPKTQRKNKGHTVEARLNFYLKTYYGSGLKIQKAIESEGKSNFLKFVIKFCKSSEEGFDLENRLADEETLKQFFHLQCMYNIRTGGRGGVDIEEKEKREKQTRLKKKDEIILVNNEDVLSFLKNGYLPANAYIHLYNENSIFKVYRLKFSDGDWRLNWLISMLEEGWQIISNQKYQSLK